MRQNWETQGNVDAVPALGSSTTNFRRTAGSAVRARPERGVASLGAPEVSSLGGSGARRRAVSQENGAGGEGGPDGRTGGCRTLGLVARDVGGD